MGIQGLLPVLKSIIEQKHVSKYAGTKVAVDTVRRPAEVRASFSLRSASPLSLTHVAMAVQYGWIHKGCYGCSLELCTNTPTDRCAAAPPPRACPTVLQRRAPPAFHPRFSGASAGWLAARS